MITVKRKYVLEMDESHAVDLKQIIDALTQTNGRELLNLEIPDDRMDSLIEAVESINCNF